MRVSRSKKQSIPGALALTLGAVLLGAGASASAASYTSTHFAEVFQPIGVAATRDKILVTHPWDVTDSDYTCGSGNAHNCEGLPEVVQIDPSGHVSLFATLYSRSEVRNYPQAEEYIAVSPGLGGWKPNYVYVVQGKRIVQITPDGSSKTVFALIPTSDTNFDLTHNGIAFDQVGTFGYAMIVSGGHGGEVWLVKPNGDVSCLVGQSNSTTAPHYDCAAAPQGEELEGPEVAPLSFVYGGQIYGGQILVADEEADKVWAIDPDGKQTALFTLPSPEAVNFVPEDVCSFTPAEGEPLAFFVTHYTHDAIAAYTSEDIEGVVGDALITLEGYPPGDSARSGDIYGILSITPSRVSVYDNGAPDYEQREGAGLVNCTVPVGCAYTQGYWKNHPDVWPVDSLTLGTVSYAEAQLLAILNQPVKGNGLVSLAHQLIAAKLNADGGNSVPPEVVTAIHDADALIGGLVVPPVGVPPVGSGYLAPAATSALTSVLDGYNNGLASGGPPDCGS
jgi:hypothetical protein